MSSKTDRNGGADSHKDATPLSKPKTESESLWGSIRRTWRSFTEYDMEPPSPQLIEESTALTRIKAIFEIHPTMMGTDISPELEEIGQVFIAGMIIGGIFGGRYGAKVHTAKFIHDNKLTQYDHIRQAERHMHSNALLGFGKFAIRWGWRVALFASMYDTFAHVLAAARNKQDGINYLGAGASTGFVYKIFLGWREVVVGVVVGTGLSIPVACVMHGLHMITPESVLAQKRQRQIDKRLRMQEDWQRRLGQAESTSAKIDQDLLAVEELNIFESLNNINTDQGTANLVNEKSSVNSDDSVKDHQSKTSKDLES